ncbi:hypothetical protein [Sulfurimonas sp.]|uniref:lipopolysaccharide biosynthesis protein n=1 Tax=Sulfurimonas sp. TaxID=2022749 RepID=UPI002B493FAA|nr:hypothetical protein [Sulfurimonas sp.]
MPSNKKVFFKGISFGYLYISVYLLTGIFTTPMLLNHFGADYFALLMLVYGIITYLNNIRFGLPESLAVLLAKSKNTIYNINLVKKNFYILASIVLLVCVIFFLTNNFVSDWRILLGDVYALNKEEVINVFFILIIFALIKIPFELSLSVFIGFHEVFLEKLYKIFNLLVNFSLVVFVVYNNENIIFFVISAGILDLMVSLVAFSHMLLRYKIFKIKTSSQNIVSKELMKNALLFFQLSITQTVIWGAGILIVSHLLSLEDVTVYSLTMKIYIYLFYAFIIVNSVIAPLYGKYYSEDSWEAIKKVFDLMILLFPFLGGIIWIGTLFFMSDVIYLWTGSKEFFIGNTFIFFMGFFFYFTGYVSSYVTLLYSIGEVKSIIHLRWIELIVNFIISIIATYFIGLVGIALGMVFPIALISTRYLPKYISEKTNNKIILDFSIQKKHFLIIILPSIVVAYIVIFFINFLMIKLVIFIVICFLYTFLSWNLLASKDKVYIISLLKRRRA